MIALFLPESIIIAIIPITINGIDPNLVIILRISAIESINATWPANKDKIANIVKKHNEKNIETVSNVTYSTNTESSTRVPTAPSTLPKRSNKLTLRRNPEDN